jgi:hypothetical protein
MLYKNKYSNVTQLQLFDITNLFEDQIEEPTQAYLRSAYNYSDLENGSLISKGRRNTRRKTNPLYPRQIFKFGKPHLLHRMIFIYHNGEIPSGRLIDHADGNPLNNRITNLRLATYSENSWNRKANKNNPYPKGISIRFNSQRKLPWHFQLQIYANKFKTYINKSFKTREEAETFAESQLTTLHVKRTQLHGEFANHG